MIEFNNKQRLVSIFETKHNKRNNYNNNFFLKKTISVIRNDLYRKIFSGPGILYEYLWSNIVRSKLNNDKYNIYEKYYTKGFLASTVSIRQLSKKCYMDKNTVKKYLNLWEDLNIIKRDKISTDVKNQFQYVYILGTWQYIDGAKTERLYLEDEFES